MHSAAPADDSDFGPAGAAAAAADPQPSVARSVESCCHADDGKGEVAEVVGVECADVLIHLPPALIVPNFAPQAPSLMLF